MYCTFFTTVSDVVNLFKCLEKLKFKRTVIIEHKNYFLYDFCSSNVLDLFRFTKMMELESNY